MVECGFELEQQSEAQIPDHSAPSWDLAFNLCFPLPSISSCGSCLACMLASLSDLPVSVENPCPVGKAESNEAHSKPTDLSFSVNKTVSFREPAHNGHSNCNGTCRNTQYLTDLPVHPHLHNQAEPKPENHPRSPVPSRRELDGRSSLQVPTIAPPGLTHCPTKTQ